MIEVLFYQGISWISKFIRWQTRSPVSHVAIRRGDEVIQAWHKPLPRGGVQYSIGPEAPFYLHKSGTKVEVYSVPRLDHPGGDWIEHRVWQWAISKVGTSYDFRMVLRFLPRLPPTPSSNKKLFCSELVAMAFVIGCYPLLERTPAAYISPGMLRASPLLDYQHTMWLEDGETKIETDSGVSSYDRAHWYEQELGSGG